MEEGASEKAISPQITEKIPLPLSLVLLREYPSFSSRCSPFPEEKALSGQNAERPRRRSFAPDPNSLQGTVFDQITGTSVNQYLASNSWVTFDKICSPHVILWQDSTTQGEQCHVQKSPVRGDRTDRYSSAIQGDRRHFPERERES